MQHWTKFNYLILALFVLSSTHLSAQVYVDIDATGSNDGTSWQNAYNNLETAIENVNPNSDVWIAEGTYTLNATLNLDEKHINLYGAFSGNEASLADRDLTKQSIISGDVSGNDTAGSTSTNSDDNLKHVLFIIESNPMVIDGIVIEGGRGDLSGEFSNQDATGGGVFCNGSINFRNCIFRNNAAKFGAGLYLVNTLTIPGRYIFENCQFIKNEGNGFGGAIYAGFGGTTFTMSDCEFENNKANDGAGIYFGGTSGVTTVLVESSSFKGGEARYGGGISLDGMARGVFKDLTFESNVGGRGGAVSYAFSAYCELEDCNFVNNKADTSTDDVGIGGAMYIENGSQIEITNGLFEANEAVVAGGAIFTIGENSKVMLNISSSEFKSNYSPDFGGAIYSQEDSDIEISSTTFNSNLSGEGGGIFLEHNTDLLIDGSSFENNEANYGGGILVNTITSSLEVSNSNFIANKVAVDGGAIYNFKLSTTNIEDCVFEDNESEFWGGALYFENSSPARQSTIERCQFISNRSNDAAGAIYHGDGNLDINSSIFYDNAAMGDGIGNSISTNAVDASSKLTMINCSLHEDASGLGAITQYGEGSSTNTLEVQNCIFSGAGVDWVIEAGPTEFNSFGGNLCSDVEMESVLTNAEDYNNLDPKFFNNNSGNLALQNGSPCINSGVVANAPDLDLEGNERVGQVDRGALEYQSSTSIRNVVALAGTLQIKGNPIVSNLSAVLTSESIGAHQLSIVNLNGVRVYNAIHEKHSDHLNIKLDLNNLNAGQYFINIENEGRQMTTPFIKSD